MLFLNFVIHYLSKRQIFYCFKDDKLPIQIDVHFFKLMTDYIELCAISQIHLSLNLETKNGNCCSMPHNPLSPLPNELLLEIIQYSISSPKELHFVVQLVSKTFAAMVQQYQQHLYKHLCHSRAKEYPFLPPIQDTNYKLFYVLHCLFFL